MRIIFTLVFILNLNLIFSQDKNDFESPMKIPLILSGTFGELRSITFTQELMQTNQEIGIPIYASLVMYQELKFLHMDLEKLFI